MLVENGGVVSHEGVQHHGDPPGPDIVTMPSARVAIHADLLPQLLDRVVEQVGEQVRANGAGALEGLRIPGSRDPDWQIVLKRRRVCPDLDGVAVPTGEHDRLSSPQPAYEVDTPVHLLMAIGVPLWEEYEVGWVPPRGKRQSNPPSRQMIDDRPLLDNPRRMVQRHVDASARLEKKIRPTCSSGLLAGRLEDAIMGPTPFAPGPARAESTRPRRSRLLADGCKCESRRHGDPTV